MPNSPPAAVFEAQMLRGTYWKCFPLERLVLVMCWLSMTQLSVVPVTVQRNERRTFVTWPPGFLDEDS